MQIKKFNNIKKSKKIMWKNRPSHFEGVLMLLIDFKNNKAYKIFFWRKRLSTIKIN